MIHGIGASIDRLQLPIYAALLSGSTFLVLVVSGMSQRESGLATMVLLCEGLFGSAIWWLTQRTYRPPGHD